MIHQQEQAFSTQNQDEECKVNCQFLPQCPSFFLPHRTCKVFLPRFLLRTPWDTWSFPFRSHPGIKLCWNNPRSHSWNKQISSRFYVILDFAMFCLSLVSAVAAVVASSLACEGDQCDASSLLQTQDWPKHCKNGTNHMHFPLTAFDYCIANFAGPGWYHSKIKRLMTMGKSRQVPLSIWFFYFDLFCAPRLRIIGPICFDSLIPSLFNFSCSWFLLVQNVHPWFK